MSDSSLRTLNAKPALTRVDSAEQAWKQQKPASLRSTASKKSLSPTQKEADGISLYQSAASLASSASSVQKTASIASSAKGSLTAPVLARLSTQEFDAKLSSLRKETKIARNVLPMLLRGGAIASIGMLLFGHLAPMAIVGVLLGATIGGYAIAKFMQFRIAAKTRAEGDNSDLAQLKRSIPEDISDADRAKLSGLINFIEKGEVFEPGVVKAFREPYRAVRNRIANATQVLASVGVAPAVASSPAAETASVKSGTLSASQTIKEDYLTSQKEKLVSGVQPKQTA